MHGCKAMFGNMYYSWPNHLETTAHNVYCHILAWCSRRTHLSLNDNSEDNLRAVSAYVPNSCRRTERLESIDRLWMDLGKDLHCIGNKSRYESPLSLNETITNEGRDLSYLFSPRLFSDLSRFVPVPVYPKVTPVHVYVRHDLDDASSPNLGVFKFEHGPWLDRCLPESNRATSRRRHPRRNDARCILVYVWSIRGHAKTFLFRQLSLTYASIISLGENLVSRCSQRWKQPGVHLTNDCKQAIREQLWRKTRYSSHADHFLINFDTAVWMSSKWQEHIRCSRLLHWERSCLDPMLSSSGLRRIVKYI